MKKDIVIAGNLIVDYVKVVDSYPSKGMLSNIKSVSKCVGGCAANTSIDLAKMDSSLNIMSIGMIGDDAEGKYLISTLNSYGVDTSQIKINSNIETSFTDVMTVQNTGERTFFHARGANARLSYDDIDFKNLKADIFHLGYALLLDAMDAADEEYGTVMARTLAKAKEHGLKTSMDVVSENSDRFNKIVTPSLKYCDYLIVNEIEASMICGIPARGDDNKILPRNIESICDKLFQLGVQDRVIVHAPEAGWYMERNWNCTCVPSLMLPDGYIKGTVGAGDAFCAGILYSLLKGFDPDYSLRLASAAAAASLSEENSIDGMKAYKELMDMEKQFKRKPDIFNRL